MSGGAPQPPSPPLPEDEHFEIALSLTQDDIALFKREYVARRDGCLAPFLVLAGLLAIGAAAAISIPVIIASIGAAVTWIEQIVLAACAAGLVVLAVRCVDSWLGKRFGWRDTPLDTNACLLVTTTGGLWFQSVTEARLHSWSAFKEMIVSDHAIYLGLDRKKTAILPQRVFGDRNDFLTFASVMAKYAHI